MNDLVKINVPSLAMSEQELCKVLSTSLYPGASIESIKLVVGWCKAQNKDPMKRPVHIVPMSVRVPGTRDKYEWRDVLMPGIGDYRTDAARTGEYAGIGSALFGPDINAELDGVKITHPEWCEISVFRMVSGMRCEFSSGRVYWSESYATAKNDTAAPNKMWRKRPRGQLEKCAEAMALRRAFPEVGGTPTADEMAGKPLEDSGAVIEHEAPRIAHVETAAERPNYGDEAFKKNLPTWTKLIQDGKKTPDQIIATVSTKGTLTDAQQKMLKAITKAAPVITYAQIADKLNAAKDADELETAAELIGEVDDPEQRKELSAIYVKLKDEQTAGAE